MNTITESNPTELHATNKLGIDAHAGWFPVANQIKSGRQPFKVRLPRKDSTRSRSQIQIKEHGSLIRPHPANGALGQGFFQFFHLLFGHLAFGEFQGG